MSKLEPIVEELKALPPAKLAEAASYIHRLKETSVVERRAALEKTAGALTTAEADEWARAIEEGCERVTTWEKLCRRVQDSPTAKQLTEEDIQQEIDAV